MSVSKYFFTLIIFLLVYQLFAQTKSGFNFITSSSEVAAWDIFEITLTSENEFRGNPFTEASLSGEFTSPTQEKINITGFCDAQDGKIFRLRFMPSEVGVYSFTLNFQNGKKKEKFNGQFTSVKGNNKGMVQVDPQYPWHFLWAGTGEHYFYFGTTAYWLMGWKDENIIHNAIDRLASYKINRIRVAINGRQDHGNRWSEPLVQESENFTFKLVPWVAERPEDLDQPGFDVTRFNVAHWQKLDRLISHAKSKNIVISLIFYVDGLDHGADPFKKANMGKEHEKRYYAYAAARYAAHANIMWDVTNEYHLFRNEAWAEQMGNFLKEQDSYNHAQSIHGHGDFPFRKSPWVDFTMFQHWDECSNYEQMINYRKAQEATEIIKPQVNEEYGYESHYPPWGCGTQKVPPGRAAETRADLAWQMHMAGCYQTTGERADEGTGAGNDEGGGWINGRGNDKMIMF
ncbi:DUF5605 domain-containing protein [soil metagenome]